MLKKLVGLVAFMPLIINLAAPKAAFSLAYAQPSNGQAIISFPEQKLNSYMPKEDKTVSSVFKRVIPQAWQLEVTGNKQMSVAETVAAKKTDERVTILKAYLAQFDSPLQDKAQTFVEAADTYNLDWKLVAAISGVESTFGKFVPGSYDNSSYNAWGWGVYGTQAMYFKSWDDGIYAVSQGLRENYFDKGLTDPYSINRVYAASPTWGAHVSYFLNDMNQFEEQYKQQKKSDTKPDFTAQVAGASGLLALK